MWQRYLDHEMNLMEKNQVKQWLKAILKEECIL